MDDDKIKDIFSDFQPQLSSDTIFLSKLRQNIDAVDMVKNQVAAQQRRNRIALCFATLLGFVSGVVMTLLTPTISNWLSSTHISLPNIWITPINIDGQIIAYMMTAAISGFIAYNTYQLTVSVQAKHIRGDI